MYMYAEHVFDDHRTVLSHAATVWLLEHFKEGEADEAEPGWKFCKALKWDSRSQRAVLQQLNDAAASSSVRQ